MFCRKCGREINEGMKFCPACGNSIEDTKTNQTVVISEEKSQFKLKETKNINIISKIFIIVTIVATILSFMPIYSYICCVAFGLALLSTITLIINYCKYHSKYDMLCIIISVVVMIANVGLFVVFYILK